MGGELMKLDRNEVQHPALTSNYPVNLSTFSMHDFLTKPFKLRNGKYTLVGEPAWEVLRREEEARRRKEKKRREAEQAGEEWFGLNPIIFLTIVCSVLLIIIVTIVICCTCGTPERSRRYHRRHDLEMGAPMAVPPGLYDHPLSRHRRMSRRRRMRRR